MKKLLLFGIASILMSSITINAKTYKIENAYYTFSPNDLTVSIGDTVSFVLGLSHDAAEVNKDVYDSNGNTSNGGFKLDFGGGKVTFDSVGVYYYVCTPHASMGMKGIIRVTEKTTSIVKTKSTLNVNSIRLYPNPSHNFINVELTVNKPLNATITIFNTSGQQIMVFKNIHFNEGMSVHNLQFKGDFKRGNYLLEVESSEGKYSQLFFQQ